MLLVVMLFAATAAAKIDPEAVRKRETDAATVIQKAYEAQDGKTYRRAMTARLTVLPTMRHAEKVIALSAYRDVVKARGGQGLEGLLLSAHGALAAEGRTGMLEAKDSLSKLKSIWRIAKEVNAPQALVAVGRPSDPYAHHLPVYISAA